MVLMWFERQRQNEVTFYESMLYDFKARMLVHKSISSHLIFRLKDVSESKEKSGFLR